MSVLEFDSTRFSRRSLDLIMRTAEKHKCSPSEAEIILLDEVAAKDEKRLAKERQRMSQAAGVSQEVMA